jgi:hypothetical protein
MIYRTESWRYDFSLQKRLENHENKEAVLRIERRMKEPDRK